MATLTESIAGQVDTLKQRAGDFARVFSDFESIRGYLVNNPALMAEWERAHTYASSVKNTVSWINSQVDSAANWLSRTIGLGGMQSGNLGALPLISAAYLVSATAALVFATDWMLKIINSAENERQKIELVKSGQASESILYPAAAPGLFNSLFGDSGGMIKWLIIGGVAWYVLPMIMEKVKK